MQNEPRREHSTTYTTERTKGQVSHYCQEEVSCQAKHLGIERPKARKIRSIRRLNTVSYIIINAKALQRAREIDASLLTTKLGKVA